MSLIFRSARLEEVPAVARIVSHSFPWKGATQRELEEVLTESPLGGLSDLWVGEDDGRIVASCLLYSFRQWIGRREIPAMGLGAVAISATSRRRGLAGRLIGSAFEVARERGDLTSALFPFRTSFYRKLGYGLAGEIQQYRIPPTALPDDDGRRRVELVESSEDRSALMAVYDRWAPRQTGQMVRTPRSWEQVWQKDTRRAVLHRDEDGTPTGYAVFRYAQDPAKNYRAIEVEEIVWIGRAARAALYGWMASLSDQWEEIVYRAHPDEGFAEHLAETRFPRDDGPRWHYWFPAATTMYGPMFRLLDVAGAWRSRRVRPGPALRVALEVHDPSIDANAGDWLLTIEDGAVEVEKGPGEGADLRLRLGIDALSRIYIGAISSGLAVRTGIAHADDESRLGQLEKLLRVPRPWTFERF